MQRLGLVAALAMIAMAGMAKAEDAVVRLHAAGSLRGALSEVSAAFTAVYGVTVQSVFGASGTLRERLEAGEAGDVFASADMGHPLMLQRQGHAGPVALFARNRLCALARPGLAVKPDTLLDMMLDPTIKLGTSTPRADPSGDYAWQVFDKAEMVMPGSRAKLDAKAIKLTGGPLSMPPPQGMSPYLWHLREGRADLFLAYCTAGPEVVAGLPGATVTALPPALATGADYGLTILKSANPDRAASLALFILSGDGQRILKTYGFDAPSLPQ
jgi:ABC-type molybdate transport system substrate-binding protein